MYFKMKKHDFRKYINNFAILVGMSGSCNAFELSRPETSFSISDLEILLELKCLLGDFFLG